MSGDETTELNRMGIDERRGGVPEVREHSKQWYAVAGIVGLAAIAIGGYMWLTWEATAPDALEKVKMRYPGCADIHIAETIKGEGGTRYIITACGKKVSYGPDGRISEE